MITTNTETKSEATYTPNMMTEIARVAFVLESRDRTSTQLTEENFALLRMARTLREAQRTQAELIKHLNSWPGSGSSCYANAFECLYKAELVLEAWVLVETRGTSILDALETVVRGASNHLVKNWGEHRSSCPMHRAMAESKREALADFIQSFQINP